MALFATKFEGLQSSDFDAYAPACRGSNRFNPARQSVRLRMTALIEEVVGTLPAGAELVATLDHPHISNLRSVAWQEVALCRAAAGRELVQRRDPAVEASPAERCHLRLGLRVDDAHAAAFCELPAAAAWDRAALLADGAGLFAALADHGRWHRADDEAVDATAADLAAGGPGVRWQQTLARDEALALGIGFGEVLRRTWDAAAPALAALWATPEVAASSEDEVVAVVAKPVIAKPVIARPAPPQAAAEAGPSRPRIAAPGSASPDPADVAAREALAILHASAQPPPPPPRPSRPAARPNDRAPPRSGGARTWEAGPVPGKKAGPEPTKRPGPEPTKKAGPSWEVGAKVVIAQGLMAGKEGEIVAVRGRDAQVRVGALAFSIATDALRPA